MCQHPVKPGNCPRWVKRTGWVPVQHPYPNVPRERAKCHLLPMRRLCILCYSLGMPHSKNAASAPLLGTASPPRITQLCYPNQINYIKTCAHDWSPSLQHCHTRELACTSPALLLAESLLHAAQATLALRCDIGQLVEGGAADVEQHLHSKTPPCRQKLDSSCGTLLPSCSLER